MTLPELISELVGLLLFGVLAEQLPARPRRMRRLTWEEQCEEDEK